MTHETILLVDDEPGIRRLMGSTLADAGYRVTSASDAVEARQQLLERRHELALLDVALPGDSGLDLLRELAPLAPDLATVMVSAHDDALSTSCAVELGAYGYVVKPFRPSELLVTVDCAVLRRRTEISRRAEQRHLVTTARRSTRELRDVLVHVQRLESELGLSHDEIVQRLAHCVDVRDGGTGAHLRRVSRTSGVLGRRLGLDSERVRQLRQASTLHDIGKIAVPDGLLLRNGPLDREEKALIETHTSVGFDVLSGTGSAMLDLAATIALTHHERVDGDGYPLGLVGDAIPLESKIVAVADTFDALTHERPYRAAQSSQQALEVVVGLSGTAFDPAVVDALVDAARNGEIWEPVHTPDADSAHIYAPDTEPSRRPGRPTAIPVQPSHQRPTLVS